MFQTITSVYMYYLSVSVCFSSRLFLLPNCILVYQTICLSSVFFLVLCLSDCLSVCLSTVCPFHVTAFISVFLSMS